MSGACGGLVIKLHYISTCRLFQVQGEARAAAFPEAKLFSWQLRSEDSKSAALKRLQSRATRSRS